MKRLSKILGACLGAILLGVMLMGLFEPVIAAEQITVDVFVDDITVNGNCTLREAIEAANTNTAVDGCAAGSVVGQDLIILPSGEYAITEVITAENGNQSGDFDILESVIISGAGATINGNSIDRIFDIGTTGDYVPTVSVIPERSAEATAAITGSIDVLIYGVTLTHGAAEHGGAIFVHTGRVAIQQTNFYSNTCGYGCGIYVDEGFVAISNSRFSQGYAYDPDPVDDDEEEGEGGAIYSSQGFLTIDNSRFEHNYAEDDGGALYLYSGVADIRSSTFYSNTTPDDGGAIEIDYANVQILDGTRFEENYADENGGAIFLLEAGIYIEDSAFINNSVDIDSDSDGYGGALYSYGYGAGVIVSSEFRGNQASYGGAAYGDGGFTISNTLFADNGATYDGGAIYDHGGLVSVARSRFENNSASEYGGAISADAIDVLFSLFTGNRVSQTDGYGGAISAYSDGSLSLFSSEFYSNTAAYGGAVYGYDDLGLFIEGSTFSYNTALFGGALYSDEAIADLLNTTISHNHAYSSGGGIYIDYGASINYSTIVSNTAVLSGGGLYVDDFTLIENTIIAGNGVSSGLAADGLDCAEASDELVSGGGNIQGIDGGCFLLEPSDQEIASAALFSTLLGPLADNGGETMTHAPLSGSVAIDAGLSDSCPLADQVGTARPLGGACDTGAVESSESAGTRAATDLATNVITVNVFTDTMHLYTRAGACTLREAIQSANSNTAVGGCTAGQPYSTATDIISLPAGTYSVTSSIDITESVVISGAGSGSTIIDAYEMDRLFVVDEADDGRAGIYLTFNELTMRRGLAEGDGGCIDASSSAVHKIVLQDVIMEACYAVDGGAIHLFEGTLYINDSVLRGNVADTGYGGAVYADYAQVVVAGSVISDNISIGIDGDGYGGGTYNEHSTIRVANSQYINNRADYGGALYNEFGYTAVSSNTIMHANEAIESGGAIYNESGLIAAKDSTFSRNTAYHGGALYTEDNGQILYGNLFESNSVCGCGGSYGGAVYSYASIHSTNNVFTANSADEGGGAIYIEYGVALIEESIFANNVVTYYGGAVYLDSAYALINQTIFADNQAVSSEVGADGGSALGGAIYDDNGGATMILNSLFKGNKATNGADMENGQGGAYFIDTDQGVLIENSTFTDNEANAGGAIGVYDESENSTSLLIRNVTVSANDALITGGGIYADSPLGIVHSTIVANNAAGDGGGLFMPVSDLLMFSSIVAGNTAGNSATNDCFIGEGATSNGANIVVTGAGCNPISTDIGVTAGAVLSSVLGPLAAGTSDWTLPDGTTLLVHQPITGGVAIDAAQLFMCLPTDALGLGRPAGLGCDIGAVEGVTVYMTYLPIVRKPVPAQYPDLVVSRIAVNGSDVEVVITNQGAGTAADDFWVDIYINPTTPPTSAYATWVTQGGEGIAWGIANTSLAPGASVTLNLGSVYYDASETNFSGTVPNGATVYAQVDSVNRATSHGNVLEDHEVSGGSYNNISSVTYAAD